MLEWAWRLANPAVLVAAVTEQEPEWSRADVESLIAYAETKRVGAHGHPMSDAVSRLGDPSNPQREWDWVVPLPMKDFAQEALNSEVKRYRDAYPDADITSLKFAVEKRYR